MTDSRSGEKIIVPDGQMRDFIAVAGTYDAVSYTHLDVYKRQGKDSSK